jgi:butyryl-CoA dehydrogenase
MDYFLSEQQLMIRETARQIAREKIVPVRAELDEKEEFPWEVMKACGSADLFAIWIPEAYGGLGGGILDLCICVEELAKACAGVAVSYAASALGTIPIVLFGSEAQKAKYLPDVAAGRKLGAFALTEAGAGSDAAGVKTTARRDGDHYVLNGTKQWITNGGDAETYTVIAITDPSRGTRGASAFIVEKGTPGFSFGKKEIKMGIRSSSTRELVFEDCRVPAANILGKEGMGFIIAMKTLDKSRPGIGAQALGIAQGAFEEAVKYSRERVQFGHPIGSFQAVQHMLANMATKIEAARALVYAVARFIDSGPKDYSIESAYAKLFPSDMAMEVTTDAVQILGGYGYMRDYPVEKMMRDAKITQIYEGTNQIIRNVIGLGLVKEFAKNAKK